MTSRADNLLILGAGFSANAGLPLASEFTRELLDVSTLEKDSPSARQVAYIEKFVSGVFGEGVVRSHDQWPELEDIFTLVDLSANTGHHLGPHYPASDLRVVRRAILVRMIRMLSRAYARGSKAKGPKWTALEDLFARFDASTSAVLSMNWDTVFERGVDRMQSIGRVDYGCGAIAASFDKDEVEPRRVVGDPVTILKPHGSVNWLYCDACRETFWFSPTDMERVARTLFRMKDWETVAPGLSKYPSVLEPKCMRCGGRSLGTRFATFSYRKALEFPMHAASWRTAEKLLKRASEWVFFGYSMPAADFDFKHLLKRVQLSKLKRPRITLITGGGKDAANATVLRFERFFGTIPGRWHFFTDGLDGPALAHLQRVGVLKASSIHKPTRFTLKPKGTRLP